MNEKGTIASIQCLRALAAVLVVAMHNFYFLDAYSAVSGLAKPALEGWYQFKNIGGIGVHIFFVISGFIMVYMLDSDPRLTAGKFFSRRLSKIVPLYWIISAFWLWWDPNKHFWFVTDSLLFIPVREVMPLAGVGWTLNYEMFFYVVFGLIAVAWRRSIMWVPVVFAGFAAESMLTDNYVVHFYANPIVWEFIAGMVVARIYRLPAVMDASPLILALGVAGLAFSAATFPPPGGWEVTTVIHWAPIGTLLVLGSVSAEAAGMLRRVSNVRLVQAIGASSYSLYLVHNVLFTGVNSYVLRFTGGGLDVGYGLLIAVACLCGWLLHRCVERPVLKAIRMGLQVGRGRSMVAAVGREA